MELKALGLTGDLKLMMPISISLALVRDAAAE
jgi:hypothetical protein